MTIYSYKSNDDLTSPRVKRPAKTNFEAICIKIQVSKQES